MHQRPAHSSASRYTWGMLPEHRARLLEILSRIDQCETAAGDFMADPVYADVFVRAEGARELLVQMRARRLNTRSARTNDREILGQPDAGVVAEDWAGIAAWAVIRV